MELLTTEISAQSEVYTEEAEGERSYVEFDALHTYLDPVLELYLEPCAEFPVGVNIIEDYISTHTLQHTDWLDCSHLLKYYYFIKNFGRDDVTVSIEISPDKILSLQDYGPFVIKAKESIHLVPMRESWFVRISFQNCNRSQPNLLKVFFQGL